MDHATWTARHRDERGQRSGAIVRASTVGTIEARLHAWGPAQPADPARWRG